MKEKGFILIFALLIPSISVAGGLFEESEVTGECKSHLRMPLAKISNPYNGYPFIEMVTARQYYGTACREIEIAERRGKVSYMDFYGKKFPLLNPATGQQISTTDSDALYAIVYSLWILENKKAAGEVGYLMSDPATICYTTSGSDPICKLH